MKSAKAKSTETNKKFWGAQAPELPEKKFQTEHGEIVANADALS